MADGSRRARGPTPIVPYLLGAAAARPADTLAQRAAQLLAGWDRRYTIDNERAVLFEAVLRSATAMLWDELPSDIRPGPGALLRPARRPDEPMVGRAEHARPGAAR